MIMISLIGILGSVIFVLLCMFGIFVVPTDMGLLLPILDLGMDVPAYTAQAVYLIVYFLEYVIFLPFVEQFYFYVFFQGQLGRENYLVKLFAFLGHTSSFVLPILTTYWSLLTE